MTGVFFMRKYIALLLSIIICIGFFGCSKGVSNTVTSTTVPNTSVIQTTEKEKEVTALTSTEKAQSTAKKQTTTKAATKVTDTTKGTKVTTTEKITKAQSNAKKPTVISTTKVSTTTTAKQTTKGTVSCTVTVECTSVLNNMDKLKAGHSAYVPNDGYIINSYCLSIKKGSSVYDAVKAACSANNVNLNAVNSSFGKYIAGFNYIDEKDCGNQSGWLYMVNGKYPSVSCDKYIVENRDKIVFEYTCK